MKNGRIGRSAAERSGRAAASIVNIVDFTRLPRMISGEDDGRRGVVLLFTGVRYERQIEPCDPLVGKGQGRRGRRR